MVRNPPPLPVDEAPPSPWWLWLPSPLVVNVWSLLMACIFGTMALVYTILGYYSRGSMESAFLRGMLWCSLPQAAAAALALLLPGHRRRSRRALGLVGILATSTTLCMYAGFVALAIVDYPGQAVFTIILNVAALLFVAVGDGIGLLSLVLGEGYN